jgi:hypothetical protein
MRTVRALILAGALALVVAGCGDDDGDTDTADDATDQTTGNGTDQSDDDAAATGSDGGGGGMTLDGEAITFDSARCFLEEQPAAAGGGSIELTGQAVGTNAAGDEVSIDFSRYSEESQFAGDDLSVVVGAPTDPDAVSYSGRADSGTVSLDGTTLSASDFSVAGDDLAEVTVSFEIHC